MKTNRGRDMMVEREVAMFLDEHLYSNSIFSKHDRTDDHQSQLSGSDIIISIPSKGIYDAIVDEKAMCNYYWMPKSLPTFALELSFYRNDEQIVEGWLTDPSKITEYYMCIWLHATTYRFTKNDITWLEYALVKRSDILQYLETQGYSINELKNKDAQIRATCVKQGPIDKSKDKEYYFFFSPQLGERPINIVIRKDVYKRLAVLHGEFNIPV